MSRPQPMQPMHDFSAMPEKVGLFQGDIEFRRGDKSRTGTGEVQLRSLPSPRVIVNAKLEGTLFDSMEISFSGSDDGMLSLNGKLIEGFLVRSWNKADGIELEWTSFREPFFIGDMQAKTTVAVVLHLFNFPDFLRGQHQDIAPDGCVLLVLDSDEWRASIQSLPHNATHQAWEKIKQEGGSHLTHVLKLERKDGAAFSADDVEGQRYMLASFCRSRRAASAGLSARWDWMRKADGCGRVLLRHRPAIRLMHGLEGSRGIRSRSCFPCSPNAGSSPRNGSHA